MAAGGGGSFCCRKSSETKIDQCCTPREKAALAQGAAFLLFKSLPLCYLNSVPRESRREAIRDSTYVLPRRDRGWRKCEHTWGVLEFPITTSRPPKTGGRMEYKKITPNLIVKDVSASLAFYEEVLSLPRAIVVPDQPPFVFASVTAGGIEIFF